MGTISLEIDGEKVRAEEGATIFEAARENGIHIPALCHYDRLSSYGACRLCMVEISNGKKTRLVASCIYPVQENLVVKTDTDRIRKIRRMIVELLWPLLPSLARKYGIEKSRFIPEYTDCSMCGLCVRYCAEVKKLNVVYFKGRGIDRQPAVVPELANECVYCRECFDLCSGGWIVNRCDDAYI